jgi:hypothetical protein
MHFTQIPSGSATDATAPVPAGNYGLGDFLVQKNRPRLLISSFNRISRSRPNLQQFSCTFVKPLNAACAAFNDNSGNKLHKSNVFKWVRQNERRVLPDNFLHSVAYLE